MGESNQKLLQLNPLHSPFSTLLPEILALVFQYACLILDLNQSHGLPGLLPVSPPPKGKRAQFILSAVSSHWRQVVFSTPRIWTSVDLTLSPSTVIRVSAVLRTFFTCSGQLPIAIALHFAPSWGRSRDFLIDAPCDVVIRQNTHRVGKLHLSYLSDIWMELIPYLSNLTKLSIRTFDEPRLLPIRTQSSHLTRELDGPLPQLSCSKLTVLHISGVDVEICLEILLRCPNLIEYRVREPEEGAGAKTWPQKRFVLPWLEVFEWCFDTDEDADLTMLQHIRMPVLRKLIWVEYNITTTGPRDVFFRNLPPSLTNIHLHSAHKWSNQPLSVFDIVCNLSNIQRLTLSYVDERFLDHVFEKLTPPLNTTGDHQTMTLQKLKIISIKDGYLTLAQPTQEKLLRMLEHRLLNTDSLDQEPLQLRLLLRRALPPRFKGRLMGMNGRGLKVEILERPKFLEWMI